MQIEMRNFRNTVIRIIICDAIKDFKIKDFKMFLISFD
jgi:hypothetical protein